MKSQAQKQYPIFSISKEESNLEDFTELYCIVENLLASMDKEKQFTVRKNRSSKKWKKKPKRTKKQEEIGIRELPFTF